MKKNHFYFSSMLSFYKNLCHGFFDKRIGNISFKYGKKQEVDKNRMKIYKKLRIKKEEVVEMDQIHSSRVAIITQKNIKERIIANTDALLTNKKNIFLMIKTADCFPLLFFDPQKEVVGIAHVGWRGALEKIFWKVLLRMIVDFNCKIKNILVAIGPGIGACCFKHQRLIQEKIPEWDDYISIKNGWKTVDLGKFIEDQLQEVGIAKRNIERIKICTACNEQFFSHFRSLKKNEKEGRFASIIGMRDDD